MPHRTKNTAQQVQRAQKLAASPAIRTLEHKRRRAAVVVGSVVAATAIFAAHEQAIKSDTKHAIQMLLDDYQIAVRTKNLANLGEPFSKTYYVQQTVHKVDSNGYRTRFKVKETGL